MVPEHYFRHIGRKENKMKYRFWFTLCMGSAAVFLLSTCAKGRKGHDVVHYDLVEVAQSDYQWTGVAVSKEGRIFVNYPRWSESIPFSVGELMDSGEVVPFPDKEWNQWDPSVAAEDHLVCVQSVTIDANNNLWILDPASPLLQGVVQGGPKLLKCNLVTNEIEQTVRFVPMITEKNSYLNDVRVDNQTNTAYITDSGTGAIVVVDLNTGLSRRVLDNHFSTKAEDIVLHIAGNTLPIKVHSDGIALDTENGFLYYQPLTGHHLYRIKTGYLRDSSISEADLEAKVERVGESGASDGLLFKDGAIYLTSIEHNSIRRIYKDGNVESVIEDSRLEWPDSFAVSKEGTIYVTTSRIAFPRGTQPYRIFKLEPGS
jgi:sugar lactone lactonase YvrE